MQEATTFCSFRTCCKKLKEEGNEKFKSGDNEGAIAMYTRALDALEKYPKDHPDRAIFINNRAAVYLKMGDYYRCIMDCTIVLGLSTNVKALNRRAQAYEGLGKLEDALADYKVALSLEAKNKDSVEGEARVRSLISGKSSSKEESRSGSEDAASSS